MSQKAKKSKIVCPSCSTRWGSRYLFLSKNTYECGCGYAVSKESIEG